jgi:hypothetical protein
MKRQFDLTDTEFETQFENCTLDPSIFNHEAHFRLAWIHINNYGIERAIDNVCFQIQNYAISLGSTDKYNVTVTISAIKAVNHFMMRSKTRDFQSFINENLRLKNDFKALLGYHYTTDIFKSEKAKIEFLEPELLPFD